MPIEISEITDRNLAIIKIIQTFVRLLFKHLSIINFAFKQSGNESHTHTCAIYYCPLSSQPNHSSRLMSLIAKTNSSLSQYFFWTEFSWKMGHTQISDSIVQTISISIKLKSLHWWIDWCILDTNDSNFKVFQRNMSAVWTIWEEVPHHSYRVLALRIIVHNLCIYTFRHKFSTTNWAINSSVPLNIFPEIGSKTFFHTSKHKHTTNFSISFVGKRNQIFHNLQNKHKFDMWKLCGRK